jgi:hypothetical protein
MRFKLYSKEKALELLARHLGMLKDNVDLTSGGEKIMSRSYTLINPEQQKTLEDIGRMADDFDSLAPDLDGEYVF